jgi:phosphoribosylaminoimidazolecarboxamide formyltransferase / IMP cyclohydrolase
LSDTHRARRRALLSCEDKTGLEALAKGLVSLGWEIVSSGRTSAHLAEHGVDHSTVESVTGSPEMLGGRVKTLHPRIHGGILADRSKPEHELDLATNDIAPIDLVVCNLYRFSDNPGIETIDVGGPTMVRAAAKNHAHVGVLTDPEDYGAVLDELRRDGDLSDETRRRLARKAFALTAAYDAAIVSWLDDAEGETLPPTIHLSLHRAQELRYGENPHQEGARYRFSGVPTWWDSVTQHGGMALSYLNLWDSDAAWRLVHDLGDRPAAVIIKHANPCGVGVADDLATAYRLAFECDEKSAFGGIVAVNEALSAEVAAEMVAAAQADIVIAPSFGEGTLEALAKKRKNTRLLEASPPSPDRLHFRQIGGGFLVQQPHRFEKTRDEWKVVSKAQPTEDQWADAELAWKVCAHVNSNAVVLVKGGQAVGIGAGQQSRVDSGEIATRKAAGRAKGGASATDGFYPFPDGVEAAAAAGVAVVVQPGGSLRDDEVIAAADEHGLALVMTGERQFLH